MASQAQMCHSPYGELGSDHPTCHMASWALIIPLAIWRAGHGSSQSPYGELDSCRPIRHMAS
ncbi:hypothetical protein Bca52824_035613 [Brassica carinata]|uniref:Uncharacterized protein n=1 Tax=Brassica carinata TaxID=52824 RepID=A0A8X7S403_BRACI|nr:hypothetical protein Bca52824_035613 [Brassica carinata]